MSPGRQAIGHTMGSTPGGGGISRGPGPGGTGVGVGVGVGAGVTVGVPGEDGAVGPESFLAQAMSEKLAAMTSATTNVRIMRVIGAPFELRNWTKIVRDLKS